MKDLKSLSLSITKPIEESTLLMVLGGTGIETPEQSKESSSCQIIHNYNDKCNKCSKCNMCIG